MPDIMNDRTKKLLDFDKQLEYELRAFSDNLSALTETPERKQYDRFCGHLSYIQELLDDASSLTRDLQPDRVDPDFLKLLSAKEHIREHSIDFSRLRGSFYQNYRMEDERDQDLERVIESEEVHPEIEELVIPEDDGELTEDELFLLQQDELNEQAALNAAEEAEKDAVKKAKRKKEQRRLEELQRRQRLDAQASEEAAREKQLRAEHLRQMEEQENEYRAQQDHENRERFAREDKKQTKETASFAPASETPVSHSDAKPPSTEQPLACESGYREEGLRVEPKSEQEHHPVFPVSHTQLPPSKPSNAEPTEQVFHAEDLIQNARWEEAVRLGIYQDPQKAISEAELAKERMHQEDDRLQAELAQQERRERDATVQEHFRERQERADAHVRLEKGHVDFSHDLYGQNDPNKDAPKESPEQPIASPAQEPTRAARSVEREERNVSPVSPSPAPEHSREQENPAHSTDTSPSPNADQSSMQQAHRILDAEIPKEQTVHVPPLSHREEPAPDEQKTYPGSTARPERPERSEPSPMHHSVQDIPAAPEHEHAPVHDSHRPEPFPHQQEPQKASVPPLSPKGETQATSDDITREPDTHTLRHEPSSASASKVQDIPAPKANTPVQHSNHDEEDTLSKERWQHNQQQLQAHKDHAQHKSTVVPPLSPKQADKVSSNQNTVSKSAAVKHMTTAVAPAQKDSTAKNLGQSAGSQAVSQGEPIYRSTPFGVRQEHRTEPLSHPSRNNMEIYASIKKGMEKAGSDTPLTISSTYLSSMAWNVHMARIDYQGKKDTPQALSAVHQYQRQRQALEFLKAEIRSGRIVVEAPKAPAGKMPEKSASAPKSPYSTQYHYTPFGVTGMNMGANGEVTGSFRINTKAVRDNFRYTADQPLKVSPKYEQAMQKRLQNATTALDSALQLKGKLPPKIGLDMHNELRLAQDAYAAFQQAKQTGTVVISGDSKLERPDFKAWQQRTQANIFGSTVYSKAANLNKVKKEEVEEQGASLLHNKSKLRYERFYNRYARIVAQKTTHYAYSVPAIFSRNLYMLVQSGEDNALRTFESGRYYAVTAVKLTNAAMHLHVVAPKRTVRQAGTQELHRFAKYVNKDNKTLAREISDKKRLGREGKKAIRSLKAERDSLHQKIRDLMKPGAVLSKEESILLKQLGTKQNAVEFKLLAAQRAHLSLNHDLRREVAYFKLRKKNADEIRIHKELREKHGAFVTKQKLRQDIADSQREASKKLLKKYGKEITAYSDKSVKQEIKNLTKQAKKLKGQIKALQAKGSSLSQAQRQMLKHLMDEHQSISQKLRRFIGLDKDRAAINAELALKGKLLNRMYANSNAFSNALFVMRRVVLRPLREGAEYGVQGFGTGMNILLNRQVHRMMKKVFKASIRYGPAAIAFLSTGDVHAASAAVGYVERGTKLAVYRTKKAVKAAAKKTAAATVQGTKKAVSAIAPQPVKQGAHYIADISRTAGRKLHAVSVFKQKLSQKFWASKVGRSVSSVTSFGRNVRSVTKAAAGVVKSVGLKVLAGFVLLFILCGVIASLAGAPAGGAAGSLILSPYEGAEGKINLGPYTDILNECQAKYDKEIEDLKAVSESTYDKVTLIPAIPDNNNREILSMMAVRCMQDLEISDNPLVSNYLKSIFEDSHFYTTEKSALYSCSGCKTKRVSTGHTESCPEGCRVPHTKEVEYCPGEHQDLTITLHVLFFDEIFTADSMGNAGQTAVAGEKIGDFRITHYCACAECCGKDPSDPYFGITATGTVATENRTIAVDPSVIPLGTHVVIDGVEYVAEDTGGAIKGNRIDIYVSDHDRAYALGVKYTSAYYASFEGDSMVETGEWEGWTPDNVTWCKTIYNMDWSEIYTGIPNVTDVMGNETNLDGVTFIDGDRAGNQSIVDTAMAQLGNVGGAPYWSWYGFNDRVEWCATFVSWCANQNGVLGSSVPKFASCRYEGVPWFQSHNQWASGGDIVPVAGDIIFFDWEGDGVPNHVGIVIGTDGNKVYTIEGNSGDAVRTKSYDLNSKLIFGYGLPNY